MHGLPHAVKDLAAARGLPHTCGSPVFADRIADADDVHVARIRAAGPILIGKTNTPDFGLGSQTYNPVWGTTANPWDPSRTAGGSSGGGAAAVAARMLPVADGSDFMGSLRNPPAFTHTVGLRPSLGRVPEPGFVPFGSINGPMAHTVPDLAALWATMSGGHPSAPLSGGDAVSPDHAGWERALERDVRGMRIGWLGDWGGHLATEPGVLELCEQALGVLEQLGCVVEPVVPPMPGEQLWETFLTWRWWAMLRHRPLYDDPATRDLLKPELVWEVEHGLGLTASDLMDAVTARDAWYATVLGLLERYDHLVAPAAQVFPFDKGVPWPQEVGGRPMDTYHRWMETVAPWTLTGLPVAAVPAGFNAAGLPTGVQVVGRWRDDLGVLQLARAWEQAGRWGEQAPAVAGVSR